MRLVLCIISCLVACAHAGSLHPARVGDVVIHGPRKDHQGHWAMLASPKGIEAKAAGGRSTTGVVATLVSSMRLPVPAVDGVAASDYVSVDDPFKTEGAQVAALFTVLQRPDAPVMSRMEKTQSFTHKLDALSTVHQMLTGFVGAGTIKQVPTIADLIPGKTVSVSGDARYARAAGNDATVIEPSLSTDDVAAAWSSPVFEGYTKQMKTSDDANSFLVAELAAAVKAVGDLELAKHSFVNVVVTGLAAVDASVYPAAQAMVDDVLLHCANILEKRTENAAFVKLVTVIDERFEVDRDVGALVDGAMRHMDDRHRVALPHVYTPYWATVGGLCDKIDRALVDSEYSVDCPKGHPQKQGAAVNSRRRSMQLESRGFVNESTPRAEENLWVWQFQIFFWLTVLFVVVILVVSTQIAGLDPGYNSIIYRMTPGQGR